MTDSRWKLFLCRWLGCRPVRKASWSRCRRCYTWTRDWWPSRRRRWWVRLRLRHG